MCEMNKDVELLQWRLNVATLALKAVVEDDDGPEKEDRNNIYFTISQINRDLYQAVEGPQ